MSNRQHDQIQYVPTGDPATVDATPSKYPYPGAVGGVYTDINGKQWQLVQGDSSMSVAPFPAAVMWWKDKSKFTVTSAATQRGLVAGVVGRLKLDGTEIANGPQAGNLFFIQKGGKGVVKIQAGPTAAPSNVGLVVIPSATAGKADVLGAGTGATYPSLGRELGWYNAAASEAYVDLSLNDSED